MGVAGDGAKAAMDAAGITRATPDPTGGRLIRAADGTPTGVLVDSAEDLVAAKLTAFKERIEGQVKETKNSVGRQAGMNAVGGVR